jgi:hypothetical protein
MFIGGPLALASWFALRPAVVAIALLVVRTEWEDRLLYDELSGYVEHARPGVLQDQTGLTSPPMFGPLLPEVNGNRGTV